MESPSIVSRALLSLMSSTNLLRVYLIPLSVSLMMLNSTDPRTEPWGAPITGLHVNMNTSGFTSIFLQLRDNRVLFDHIIAIVQVFYDNVIAIK